MRTAHFRGADRGRIQTPQTRMGIYTITKKLIYANKFYIIDIQCTSIDLISIYVYVAPSKPNPPKTDLHHPRFVTVCFQAERKMSSALSVYLPLVSTLEILQDVIFFFLWPYRE